MDDVSHVLTPFVGASFYRSKTDHAPLPSEILDLFGNAASIGATTSDIAPALLQLQDFTHRLYVWELPPSFFIQLGVAGILVVILLLTGSYMVLHRLLRRKFWLVRLTRRPTGLYFIPNAYNCFLVFLGFFGTAWISFAVLVILGYHHSAKAPQRVLIFFSSYVWCPLYIAAYFAGWGSFYTAPNTLASLDGKRMNRWLRRPRAWVMNLICLGTPLLFAISLIPPTAIGQINSNRGFDTYLDLATRVQQALSEDTTLSAAQVRSLLSQADIAWNYQAEALRLLAIAYTLWAAWASCLITFYIAAGGYLVLAVWRQLRRQKDLLESVRKRQQGPIKSPTTQNRLSSTERTLYSPRMSDLRRKNSVEQAAQEVSAASALLFQPLSMSAEESYPVPGKQQVFPVSTVEAVNSDGKETKHTFFPPLRPDARRRAVETYNPNGTPATRYRYIRRCFITLATLYFGIILGLIVYLFTTARLAAKLYEAILTGPAVTSSLIYQSHIPPAYANVIFGGLTVGSIWSRYFDSASARSPRPTTRDNLTHKRRVSANEQDPYAQERTRTLATLPQSVSTSVTAYGEEGAGKLPQALAAATLATPRGFSERRGIFNFRLARDVSRPNDLMMQQMDVSGVGSDLMEEATFERIEAEQTGTHRSRMSHMSRRSAHSARSRSSKRGILSMLRPSSPAEQYPQDVSGIDDVSAMSFNDPDSGASSQYLQGAADPSVSGHRGRPPIEPYIVDGLRNGGRSSTDSTSALSRLSHHLTAASSRLTFSSGGSKSDLKMTSARRTPLPADVPPAPRTPLRALPRQSSDTMDSQDSDVPMSSPREWIAREWAAADAEKKSSTGPQLSRSLSLNIVPGTPAPSQSIHKLGLGTPPSSMMSSPRMGRPNSSYSLQQARSRATPSPFSNIQSSDAAAAILNPDAIGGASTPDHEVSARSSLEASATGRRSNGDLSIAPTLTQKVALPTIPPSPLVGYFRRRSSISSVDEVSVNGSPSSVFGELPSSGPRATVVKRVPVPSFSQPLRPYTSPKRPLSALPAVETPLPLPPRHHRHRSMQAPHSSDGLPPDRTPADFRHPLELDRRARARLSMPMLSDPNLRESK